MYYSFPVSQTEIENMLLEKCDKNQTRIHSLVNINFIILLIYIPVFAFTAGYFGANVTENTSLNLDLTENIINSNHSVVSIWSLNLGIICIILSFYLLVMQAMRDEHKFKKVRHPTEGDLIQVRTGKELQNHNVNLFTLISNQNSDYIMSLVFSTFSLILFYNYYAGVYGLLFGSIILAIFFMMVYLRFRIPLMDFTINCESQETRIKKLEIQMHELIEKLNGNLHK